MSIWDLLRRLFGGGKEPSPTPEPPTGGILEAMLALHNDARDREHVGPLTIDSRLAMAAQNQAAHMARIGKMTHGGQGGSTVGQRINKSGYRWHMAGENVAAGQRTMAEAFRSWWNSAGHRANILESDYEHAGFATATGKDGTQYWCAVFAKPIAAGSAIAKWKHVRLGPIPRE